MDVALFHLEIIALGAVLVGLHALKPRLGLAPIYLAMGLLVALMMVGGRLGLEVPVLTGGRASYSSLTHLSLILAGVVLVYALEGTREARRLILALVLVSLLLVGMRLLIAHHLYASGLDLAVHGRDRWIAPPLWSSTVSTAALLLAGVLIIVLYQALLGLRVPQVVALSLALVAATVADGLIYGGLSGRIDWGGFGEHVVGKLTASVAAAIPVATYIASRFRRASEHMRHGVLDRGAFEIMSMRRELSDLQQSLSKSRAQYEHARSLFSRYVSPDVVDEVLRDTSRLKLGGELREVTILFADIRGYSTLSEHLSPEQTIDLLNQYFSAMGDAIHGQQGTILEFEGDAILTVFGAPLDQPDHAARALRAALDMLAGVVTLNQGWEADGTAEQWKRLDLPSFRIRIGLHTGEVVVGNIGSEARTKYTVIGDAVNTAARIEQYNKRLGTTLLMSASTVERAGRIDRQLNDFGWHKLRGRTEPVQLFSVWPLPGVDKNPLANAALDQAARGDATKRREAIAAARNREGPIEDLEEATPDDDPFSGGRR